MFRVILALETLAAMDRLKSESFGGRPCAPDGSSPSAGRIGV